MELSNLLGVVLAFITVLLLLSLVVMALVQFSQAVRRLRSPNLLFGCSRLFASTDVKPTGTPDAEHPPVGSPTSDTLSPLRRDAKLCKAAMVLHKATDVHRRLAPKRHPNATLNVIRGPKVM